MEFRQAIITFCVIPPLVIAFLILLALSYFEFVPSSPPRPNFYAKICPDVESIVHKAIIDEFQYNPSTIPKIMLLYFHDCFVNGCDASIMIESTKNNTAEKDHPDNMALDRDVFATIIKIKDTLDAIPKCRHKVSCADILTIAVRDAITTVGGPRYEVELGRFDGLTSTAASVEGKFPQPTDGFDKIVQHFVKNGLTVDDMVALSGAHTVGRAHCTQVFNRIYSFNKTTQVDPTVNKTYVSQLQASCPRNAEPRVLINLDPTTPNQFDNAYYQNLQQGKGLFASDQVLFTDRRSKPKVELWARNGELFNQAFVNSMIKLGRVGVKTGRNGNIRRDCAAFN